MKKLIAGLALTLLAAFYLSPISPSAVAQNVMCPTRPVGDSTNACASTAFVQSQSFVTPGGIPSTSIIIGTTVVTPNNSNAYLYNNSGVVGERTGTSTQVLHGGSTGFTQIVNADITPAAGINLSKLESVAANTYIGVVTPAGAPSAQSLSTCAVLSYTANTGFGCSASSFVALPQANALRISNNTVTPNSYVDLSADTILLLNPSGPASIYHASYSCTINFGTTGAGGLDTGSVSANTWYFLYALSNGSTPSCLASTSATSPTLPGGYSYYYRVGATRTAVDTTVLFRILQYGADAQYIVTASSGLPIMANTGGTVTIYASVSVTPFVPTTASRIRLNMVGAENAGAIVAAIAPNNNYDPANTATTKFNGSNIQATGLGQSLGFNTDMALESSLIYYGGVVTRLNAQGWKDRVNAN